MWMIEGTGFDHASKQAYLMVGVGKNAHGDGPERYVRVATSHDYPPIPDRNHDWSAIDYDTYDGEGCPIGRGPTENDAIADLIEQLTEAT